MVSLMRGLVLIMAVVLIVNGGYWETHHHLWSGALMALFGIVSIVLVSGASALYAESEPMRLE